MRSIPALGIALFSLAVFIHLPMGRAESDFPGHAGRHDFRWDLNLSTYVSIHGDDLVGTAFSHIQPTDRSPRNYMGFDYTYLPADGSWARRHWIDAAFVNPHLEMNFQPREVKPTNASAKGILPADEYPYYGAARFGQPLSYDFTWGHRENGSSFISSTHAHMIRLGLVFYDLWVRLQPPGMDRTTLRIGHFPIPYGADPLVAPRGGEFIMPPEMLDVGIKRDWGVALKGPLGTHDYEVAVTSGMGLGIWNPHWFGGSQPASYVLSARVGLPRYRKFQYGFSGLFGRIPPYIGDLQLHPYPVRRWRVSFDTFLRPLHNTAYAFEVGAGQNEVYPVGGDRTILSGHVLMDYVPEGLQWMSLKGQFKWMIDWRNGTSLDYLGLVLEAGFSLTDAVMLRLDVEHVFESLRQIVPEDTRFYVGLSYYK